MADPLRGSPRVFVDTGAWIALAIDSDPHHGRAVETWTKILTCGAKPTTSVPVVLETFTFLERNTRVDIALDWKDKLLGVPRLRLVECTSKDVAACWEYFRRRDLHRLSAVDATSFVLMRREKIRAAFAFDHHFAAVGFDLVG